MKNIVKSFFLPVITAILIGCILGSYFYKTYKLNLYDNLSSSRLYLIQNGEYDTIDVMRQENIGNDYIYYEDDNKYKTVIGITRNYDNIDKIKSLYSDNLQVTEYYIATKFLDTKQDEYDKLLLEASSLSEVKEVVGNILKLYQSDNDIRLIALS